MVWLDLRDPDRADLAVISEEFGLHPLAVEDAVHEHQRPKLDRYDTHLFLTALRRRAGPSTGELATSELAAFVTPQALVTVARTTASTSRRSLARWDASPTWPSTASAFLLYGLLDYIVDGHFEAVQALDDEIETLEDLLFDDATDRTTRCSGAASSCASAWCCCAGSCCRCARW